MKALILGIIILAAAVFAGFCWWDDVLTFLRGALPVIAAFIGLIAAFIGIADIKDRAEAKKEEAAGEKTE
jgi:ABC-type multidrug transport system permease subunit